MIPLTVTPRPRRRYEVSRPDRRDTVILRASSPEDAAHEAAYEWGLEPDAYTIHSADPANHDQANHDQERTP